MNCKEIFEKIITNTQTYLEENKLQAMILGISGGIDSTLTAAICHEIENRTNDKIQFYGVSLPCSTNSDEENNSALKCMKAFCKPGRYWVENLQKEYSLMFSTCSVHGDCTQIGKGNIKARLRMIYLYDLAQKNHGIVMDTDNLTEHYLGFFTIHGDVADFNPIGGLWKHEIYELVNWLRDYYNKFTKYVSPDSFDSKDEIETRNEYAKKVIALSYALNITPTDGNGVKAGGDMAQIAPGHTYNDVDDILETYLTYIKYYKPCLDFDVKITPEIQLCLDKIKYLNDKYGEETVNMVLERYRRSEFKRKKLPIVVDRDIYKEYI